MKFRWVVQLEFSSHSVTASQIGTQWAKALQLLREMKARGLQPTVTSYTAIIAACEKGQQWEKALQLLDEMRTQGLHPDVMSYHASVIAYQKNLQWEKASQIKSESHKFRARRDHVQPAQST